MPAVSVIVPVYNVEKHLARCLDSILAQTEGDIEVVCVDDGSPDGSAGILAGYAARDRRVRVVTQENRGLSGARNAGLDVCTGGWVMFVDSDDWIPADAVEGFLRVARESGAAVVASERYAVDAYDGGTPREFHWRLLRPALRRLVGKRKMQSSAWNKFYRADLLKDRRFIEGIFFEDWPFVTELFGDVDAFACVREPMYVYCRNGGGESIVRSPFTERKAESYRVGIRHVTEHFKEHPQRKWAMKRVDTARRMLEKRMRKAGMAPPGRTLLSRVFRVETTAKADKFRLFGVPVYKRKYGEGKIRRYLLGVPIGTDRRAREVPLRNLPLRFPTQGFCPFDTDDSAILEALRSLGEFTYVPNPGNLGDMLIAAATLQFFDRNKLPYKLLSGAGEAGGSVVIGGGGIWIGEYERGWGALTVHLKSASKVVILPSSFRDCGGFLKMLDGRFTVFCREEDSYGYLMAAGVGAKVLLDHDMAFRLKGDFLDRESVTLTSADDRALRELAREYPFGRRTGRFLRRDCEKAQDMEGDTDLSYCFRGSERAPRSFIDFCACVMLAAVDGVETVVTDRLHVAIAAALMGKDVRMLDNSYGKLSAVYRRTMSGRANVRLVEPPRGGEGILDEEEKQ